MTQGTFTVDTVRDSITESDETVTVSIRGGTNVSLGYLSQIELGKNSASIETLYRICLALGMKMSELFQAVQRN